MKLVKVHLIWTFLLLLITGVGNALFALTPEEIFDELSGPIVVTTKTGREFSGVLHSVSEDRLGLGLRIDRGGVEYVFHRDEVTQLRLPGSGLKPHALDLIHSNKLEEGLSLIDLLFVQREPFFSWLPESEVGWFAENLEHYLQAGRAHDMLLRAKRLKRESPGNLRWNEMLEDSILLGYYLTGAYSEAQSTAIEWSLRFPRTGRTALGWWVLGQLSELDEDWENAFYYYLRPIVFSGSVEIPYLNFCYAGAIHSAKKMGENETAVRLKDDQLERSLKPPEALNLKFSH